MTEGDKGQGREDLKLLLPYFVPYFLFVAFAYANKLHPNAMYVVYPIKTIVVGIVLICLGKHYTELKWKFSIHGIWVGLLALAVWLVPFWKFVPQLPAPDVEAGGFNPLQFEANPLAMWSLILFRVG